MNPSLIRWTEQHALLMSIGIAGAWLEHSTPLLVAMAAGSFLGLLIRSRGQFTAAGPFGLANGITLARVLGALGLLMAPELNPWWQALAVLMLLGADGLDGWVARRQGTASDFGHGFDQEADALLLLVTCLLLAGSGRLGAWILLPGALRYGFVLFGQVAKPPSRAIRGNAFTRSIGVTATLGFAACLPPALSPEIAFGLAATLALALAGSFLYSVRQLYRTAPA